LACLLLQDSSAEEKEMARNAASLVAPDHLPVTVNEGEEPDEFWSSVGGESEYKRGCDGLGTPLLVPRLFHCYVSPAGKLRVEEISHFTQEVIHKFFTQFYWLWKPRK
jgi:gelsolin